MTGNDFLLLAFKNGYNVDKYGNILNTKGKKLKTSSNGYLNVGLHLNGKSHRVSVHRLAAYQKFGDKLFEKGIQVRHLNGNPLDNSYDNISIGTASENALDISKDNRIKRSSLANRRFKREEVISILKDRSDGMSYNKLSKKYNICKGELSYFFNKSLYVREIEQGPFVQWLGP